MPKGRGSDPKPAWHALLATPLIKKNVGWLMPHRQVCKNKSFSFKFSSWAFQIFHLQAFFAGKTKTRMVWCLF